MASADAARARALLVHDLRAIRRDAVMRNVLFMMVVLTGAVAWVRHAGHFEPWWPTILMVYLIAYMPGLGYLFGMLFVDEHDGGLHRALRVTPLSVELALAVRLTGAFVLVAAYAVFMVVATRMIAMPAAYWILPLVGLALSAPWVAVTVPALSTEKVQAIGLFKVVNAFVQLAALNLFLPLDAWYTWLLLVSPATWSVRGLLAYQAGAPLAGTLWSLGGIALFALLLALSIRRYRRVA